MRGLYPVKRMLGNELKNAWLVGFEEAVNGDYQDALLLVENVEIVGVKGEEVVNKSQGVSEIEE